MENKTVGIIIAVAVAILMGVILVNIIAEQTVDKTSVTTYTDTASISSLRGKDGSFNYTLAESNKIYADVLLSHSTLDIGSWANQNPDCAISTITLKNVSGATMSNADDYTWVEDGNGANGWLRVKDTGALNTTNSNTTTVTYTTCPSEYITESWQRTILNLVPGFFVLAILLGAAFVIIYILRQEGIDLSI